MNFALSRTGVATLRMQTAALDLLARPPQGDAAPAPPGPASSVCRLNRDPDQVAHALHFIAQRRQEIMLHSADLRHSLRTPLAGVESRHGDLLVTFARPAQEPPFSRTPAILTGRFLRRPVVFAVEALAGSAATHRVVKPTWMLLADQRGACRVLPRGCRIALPGFGMVPVNDLSETGIAFTLPTAAALRGAGSDAMIGATLAVPGGASVAVKLGIVRQTETDAGAKRVAARLRLPDDTAANRLRHLIGRSLDLAEGADGLD